MFRTFFSGIQKICITRLLETYFVLFLHKPGALIELLNTVAMKIVMS